MHLALFSIYWELEKKNMSDKKSYAIEYDFHSSPQLLFQYLSTPSGLSEWFADNVNYRGEIFIFFWDDSEESAKLIRKTNNEKIQFQWLDDESTDFYFELRIQFDEITKDVSLIVTDFADDEDEVEESKLLWTNQVADLKKVLGST